MEMICINCPLGCVMEVTKEADNISVKGNTCKRGEAYAVKEWTAPVRTVTTSVYVRKGILPVISVKTREAFPKEKIFDLLRQLKTISLEAPVKIGDVIIENALGTGIDIVATQQCEICPGK